MSQSGDKCSKCGGRMRTITSRRVGSQSQWQRLECKECGERDSTVVPRAKIFPRSIEQNTRK